MHTTIAVIGGTGKAGKYLVKALRAKGYTLRLLMRRPDGSPGVLQGDVGDYDDVYHLLAGCAAVISTLGQPKGSAPLFHTATANVLRAMEAHGIKRYILVTGLSINVKGDKKSVRTKLRSRLMKKLFPGIIRSKQLEYRLLEESKAEWTLLRLPAIVQTDEAGPVKVSLTDCPGMKISATSLALYLISQLDDKQYRCKAPFIANA